MKYLCLIFILLSLYPAHQSYRYSKQLKFPFFEINQNYKVENYKLYRGIITGKKNGIPLELKKVMKKYGTIHLLTPSGIHLSSFMVFLRFIPYLEVFLLLILLIIIQQYQGYDSLERVASFRLIYKGLKQINISDIEICFITTIILSLFLGHYQRSELSLIYSLAFWGTIIIFRKNPLKTIFYLNFTLFFLASLSGSHHSPLSIFVNPIITTFVSILFPFLFLNTLIPNYFRMDTIANYLLEFISWMQLKINELDPLPLIQFSTLTLIIFLGLIHIKKYKVAWLFLCLISQSNSTTTSKPLEKFYSKVHRLEPFEARKNRWYMGTENKCKLQEHWFYCKKKPSKPGGPNI